MATNKSVIKTLKILELISKSPNGITLSEICKELEMPKATAYDILQALYQEDAVYYKNEILKTYVIGSKLFTLGQSYTKNSNFISFASPLLKEFAEKYEASTFACKRLGTKVTYVYKYESSKMRLASVDTGTQLPLYKTVPGICFLTFLNKEKSEELKQRILNKEFSGKKTQEFKDIDNQINKFINLGYVIDNGESDPLVCDFAAPVFNFENKVTGVIYATKLIVPGTDNTDEYIKDFLEIARKISIKQGYNEWKNLL